MKLLIACALVAVASATPVDFYGGNYAAPVSYGHSFAPAIVKAPVYASSVQLAPVVKHVSPGATSYQTFSQVHVAHPQPVVKYAAPVVKYAAPAYAASYAATPVYSQGYGHGYYGNSYGPGYGHGYGHGY